MKTTIYTMIVLLAFNTGILYAGGMKHYTINADAFNAEAKFDPAKLAPATPTFAEFSDGTEAKPSVEVTVSILAPATPKEADFEDASLPVEISPKLIAPISPMEPEFEEIDIAACGAPALLAPAIPAEADFTD